MTNKIFINKIFKQIINLQKIRLIKIKAKYNKFYILFIKLFIIIYK